MAENRNKRTHGIVKGFRSPKTKSRTLSGAAPNDKAGETPSRGGTQLNIGGRLKYARMMKGMRLADLAERAECSLSLLSKLENDKAQPSLSLLHRLSQALDTNIQWFFTSESETPKVVLRREERLMMNFNLREIEGTLVERLAPYFSDQLMQALLFIIEPEGHSLSEITHVGEDFGLVIEGQIDLTVNGQTFTLNEGDGFQFRSELPHGYRNKSGQVARVLWINTPPTY